MYLHLTMQRLERVMEHLAIKVLVVDLVAATAPEVVLVMEME